jgi:tetratricopeptide (TPR) repeat protein
MARYYLGQTYFFEGKLDEARASLEHSLTLEPGLANAEVLLGLLSEVEIRNVEALVHFRRAHHVNPACGLALYHTADLLRRSKQYREAMEVYRALHEADPEDIAPRYYLARVEEERGHPGRAEELLGEITSEHPQFAAGHRALGDLRRQHGDKEGAVASYEHFAEAAPHQAEAHLKLGAVLADLGELDRARGALERALELREDLAEAHYELGVLLYTEFSDPEQAVRHLERAVELNPSDPSARLILNELKFLALGGANE